MQQYNTFFILELQNSLLAIWATRDSASATVFNLFAIRKSFLRVIELLTPTAAFVI